VNPFAIPFVVVYLAVALLAFVEPATPRIFWTVAMPAVPLFFVIAGFHAWRRACPIATIASLGGALAPHRRRIPSWLSAAPLVASLGLLYASLVARHVATNGDGPVLGGFLLALAVAAIATNATFSGKTWCNSLCPVGVVERIYTDGGDLGSTSSSRCGRCTGCTRRCPDVDQDGAARSDASRRAIATRSRPSASSRTRTRSGSLLTNGSAPARRR